MVVKSWIVVLSMILAFSTRSWAHPVAFTAATQIQVTSSSDMAQLEAYYTYKPAMALGVNIEWMNYESDKGGGERWLYGIQHNWLLKRWNLENAQGNIYAGIGGGVTDYSKEENSDAFGRAILQMDYETRRIYTAFKETLDTGSDFTHANSTLSLGVAPYLHDFGKLATWVIVDFNYVTEFDDHVRVIPKLRFFTKSWYLEVGMSVEGEHHFSLMHHF